MKEKVKKLKRVVFEYTDGTIEELTDRPQKWLDDINGMCAMAQNRVGNQNPFSYNKYKWNKWWNKLKP